MIRTILLATALVSALAAQAETKTIGWRWGTEEGEGGEPEKQAWTESLGLVRCKGLRLTFVLGPDGPDGLIHEYERGWRKTASEDIPFLGEGGLDGYYFDIDVSKRPSVRTTKSVSICPARDSKTSDCRRFSWRNFSKAVAFICARAARTR